MRMSEKKALKRDVKAVWDRVKRLRTDRAKDYAPEEIESSAEQLDLSAQQLRERAKQLSARNAMPPGARQEKPLRKKGKRATKASAKEKAAKE